MSKSRDAFRTISEVADWLETPAHVLRFWESKFAQVKPVKRAGGRRYYRPADMALLGGIKRLLHDEGMTIKGAQKVLREQGVRHVAALSQPVEDLVPEDAFEDEAPFIEAEAPEDTVVAFPSPEPPRIAEPGLFDDDEVAEDALPEGTSEAGAVLPAQVPDEPDIEAPQDDPTEEPRDAPAVAAEVQQNAPLDAAPDPDPEPAPPGDAPPEAADASLPSFLKTPMSPVAPPQTDNVPQEAAAPVAPPPEPESLPEPEPEPEPLPEPEPAPPPRFIPPEPDLDAIRPRPGALTHLARTHALDPAQAAALAPLVAALRAHLDRMLQTQA